jgi:hypothetical protein
MALETMKVFKAVQEEVYTKEAVDELFRRIRERIEALEAEIKELRGKKE